MDDLAAGGDVVQMGHLHASGETVDSDAGNSGNKQLQVAPLGLSVGASGKVKMDF